MKRTPTRAEGGITKEEKQKLELISKKWIDISFKTGETDKVKLEDSIKSLYRVSGLKEPRVVVVPSPLVMAYAYGLAAGWWYKNRAATDAATYAATDVATYVATYDATHAATDVATYDATRVATRAATDAATYDATYDATRVATRAATDAATYDATYDATHAATDDATRAATYAATYDATYDATRVATYDATHAATDVATYDATRVATRAATDAATYDATYDATHAATDAATYDATHAATDDKWLWLLAVQFAKGNKAKARLMINCIGRWTNVYQGGNMWSAFPSYAEGMRDVIGLTGLKCWEAYQAWEDAAKYGGFRVLHPEFCIVSEFPETLVRPNSDGRLHCATGPTHRWKDGFEIYHLNGIRVPKWLVMTDSGQIDPQLALAEKNVDIQREIIRKIGAERMIKHMGSKPIDTFIDSHTKGGNKYDLYEMKIGQINRKYLFFEHASFTGVWYAHPIEPRLNKALHARAWMLGVGEVEELQKKSDSEIKKCLPLEVA